MTTNEYILLNLEAILIDLTQNLYKYVYEENDLEKLGKDIPIEYIDSTKTDIEVNIVGSIVGLIANGCTPQDKRAYEIIENMKDVLNLENMAGYTEYNRELERVGFKKKKVFTVQDLINELNLVENKSKPVFIYTGETSDVYSIDFVDTDITDRVDINIAEKPE